LEDYLRCYPSGKFCELAQFRIERLYAQREKSLPLASIAANPFSSGTARADANFAIGDSYTYRTMNVFTRSPNGQITETVTGLTGSDVIFNQGEGVIDLLANHLKSRFSNIPSPTQFYPSDYAMGRKWAARLRGRSLIDAAFEESGEMSFKVAGKETITVRAGTFEAFRIEGTGFGSGGERWRNKFWVAPEISRRPIATDFTISNRGRYVIADRYELSEFKQKISPAPEVQRMRMQITQRVDLCNRDTAGSGLNFCYPV
jgi:hypothetical protein